MKRKSEIVERQLPLFAAVKKQRRSKIPRRCRRFQISPPLLQSTGSDNPNHVPKVYASIECDSRRGPVKENRRDEVRGATGAFIDRRQTEKKRNLADAGEVSETSCVESCSGAVSGRIHDTSVKYGRAEDSEAVSKSEISAVTSFTGENTKLGGAKTIVSETSLEIDSINQFSVQSVCQLDSESRFGTTSEIYTWNSADRDDREEESGEENAPIDLDFTCSEDFSDEVACDYSSAYSDFQSQLFGESSECDFSDYTPSIWYDSGSQFSEKSVNDESPSPTFQLLQQFSHEFCKSTFALAIESGELSHLNDSQEITLLGLEGKEEQERYKLIRIRERRQVYLQDYTQEYTSSTNYGDLIVQQRLQMVHWIVEQSTNKELQLETLFLGVSLLDRFLSKGYFKTKRSLQIAGIACLTLATRFEENQPHNSVDEKIFHIGTNSYSRCEVVAMEWLVQEVLKFQCFLPSLYNFFWFYLRAARASEKVEKTVKHLAVLTLLGREQLCFWPSTVAAGLVILASVAAKQETSCYNITQTHARMKANQLPECLKKLSWLVKYIN